MAQGDGGQVEWLDELVAALRRVHDNIISESGGVFGEHTSSLYAASARPFQTAFEEDLYPTSFDKAGALFHAIICDHVFVDGNKRTATAAAIGFLALEGVLDIEEANPLVVQMVGALALETASTSMTVQQVAHWLRRILDRSLLSPPGAM